MLNFVSPGPAPNTGVGEALPVQSLRGSPNSAQVPEVPPSLEGRPSAGGLLAAGLVVGGAVGVSSRGRRSNLRRPVPSKVQCRAEYLSARDRVDGHGWVKVDPTFDPSDTSCYGQTVSVEMKKRPMGVTRYTHCNGKGAMVAEMHEVSRYPGDPRGQAAVGGVKKNWLVKSINGQEVTTWDFCDIMDLLEDVEANYNNTQDAQAAWEARPRKHQAVALPAVVEFLEFSPKADNTAPKPVVEEGKWYPRPGGYTDAELDAELARVKAAFPVPAGYTGVQYTGKACLNEAWINAFMEQQKNGVLLPKAQAYALVIDTIKLQRQEKTMNQITIPPGGKLTICGDTHGQYWDTMTIFQQNGIPSESNPYIFNGDYVDRGSWSIENALLLYAMKVKDPAHMFFTRGNHELIEANLIYGFCGETIWKYDEGLFNLFSESFRLLPLCHLVNNECFVTHGGLPGPAPRLWLPGQSHDPEDAIPVNPNTISLQRIAAVDRYTELQEGTYKASVGENLEDYEKNVDKDSALIIDLLWGDPRGGAGYGPSYRKSRGVFMFGPDVSEKFCKDNNLNMVIRSHEMKAKGWQQDHPTLWTVFSAANYMDKGGNDGGFLNLVNQGGPLTVVPHSFPKGIHPPLPPMIYQEYMTLAHPHLTKQMKKKSGLKFDSEGNVIGEIEVEQGDDDFVQQGFADEWVEDDSFVATEDLSPEQVEKAFNSILATASVKVAA